MGGDVKRRSYDRAGREARSAQTRRRIVESARDLVIERGYRATTIAAVARRAGVNVDTVYELVGRKPVLLRELIEQAISGTDRAVVAEEREHVKAMRAEPDPARKLAIYAKAIRETHARLAPLFLALRDASSTEPEAARVWQAISERRAANMRKFARNLARRGRSAPGPVDRRGGRRAVGDEQPRALPPAHRRPRVVAPALRALARRHMVPPPPPLSRP